jgi:hypothetical protein
MSCIDNVFNPTALPHTEEYTVQAMRNSQKLEQEWPLGIAEYKIVKDQISPIGRLY